MPAGRETDSTAGSGLRLGDRFGTRGILCAMGCVIVLWGVTMVLLGRLDNTPSWWPSVDASDESVIEAADLLERAFASQASMVRAQTDEHGSAWQVAINQQSANAWLAVRLRGWAEDGKAHWPEQVEGIRVGFHDERVALGVRVRHDSGSSIAWLLFTPEVRADGSVWVETHSAGIGGVPMPERWVIEQVASHFAGDPKPGDASMRSVLAGQAPMAVDPVVHLPDGRDVRIVGLQARGGRVELSLRTESAH